MNLSNQSCIKIYGTQLRLHNPYEYIPISYANYGFNYRIHTHASSFSLNINIEIIQKVASQLKLLRTIIKT